MSRPAADVVVVGGGPAGAASAIVLAEAGRRVVLLERRVTPARTPGEALPPSARPLLRELGALNLLTGQLPSYGTLSVWGSATPQHTDFIAHPYGAGWHLDRAAFDAALRERAVAAGVELRAGVTFTGAARCAQGWRLPPTPEHAPLTARWLVDATGRAAVVARALGLRRRSVDRLVAGVVHLAAPADGVPTDPCRLTRIEATPDGWWYSVPVPGGRVAACLTDAATPMARTARTTAGFAQVLAGAGGLGAYINAQGYRVSAAPQIAAAATSRLEQYAGPGWLAVGDAAVAGDPLLGQGLLSALYSGVLAGRAIHAALNGNADGVARYNTQIATLYTAYVRNRAACYAAEQRWPNTPFWRARHEAQPV